MPNKQKTILGLIGVILFFSASLQDNAIAAAPPSEQTLIPPDAKPTAMISIDEAAETVHTNVSSNLPAGVVSKSASAAEIIDLWQYIPSKFVFKTEKNPRINRLTDRLRHDTYHFRILSQRARPFLYSIVTAVEKRNLPMELSLLPMIESGFQPHAVSSSRAAGLWQITRGTGRHLGLERNRWYDGRYDIRASTEAALNYLEYLHRSLQGDWFLALAAYNAGEGTVRRAIRANRRRAKPTDYWSLKLPRATQLYVPKLLALARVIDNPAHYGVRLPEIPNTPHLVNVDVGPRMRLSELASLAATTKQKIKHFNAALRQDITPPDSPYSLWLPSKNAHLLVQRLEDFTRLYNHYYIVQRGDTLYGIARRHRLSYRDLARWNNIDVNGLLMPGQKLLIEPFQG